MNPWIRRIFLVASIGGGFVGFAVTSVQLFHGGQQALLYVLLLAVTIAYLVGVYGGLLLVENEAKGVGILSWYFLAQVPIVISPILTYQFSSGAVLSATFGTKGLTGAAFLGGSWQIYLFQLNNHTFALGLNFFALWATWYLRRRIAALARGALAPGLPSLDPAAASPAQPPVLPP